MLSAVVSLQSHSLTHCSPPAQLGSEAHESLAAGYNVLYTFSMVVGPLGAGVLAEAGWLLPLLLPGASLVVCGVFVFARAGTEGSVKRSKANKV